MCAASDLLVQTLADERGPRLPVTDFGLERIPFRRRDVRRIRNNEVPIPPRPLRARPRADRCRGRVFRSSRERGRARPARSRQPSRAHRDARRRSRARSRRTRCRDRAPSARARPRGATRQRSTTISVSGLGTSARASVFRVRCLNPHSPRTYASGSRRARRSTSSCRPSGTLRSRSTWSCDRVTPRTCATSSSESTCGVSTPAAPRRSSASRSASATVTRRARACALRRRALR